MTCKPLIIGETYCAWSIVVHQFSPTQCCVAVSWFLSLAFYQVESDVTFTLCMQTFICGWSSGYNSSVKLQNARQGIIQVCQCRKSFIGPCSPAMFRSIRCKCRSNSKGNRTKQVGLTAWNHWKEEQANKEQIQQIVQVGNDWEANKKMSIPDCRSCCLSSLSDVNLYEALKFSQSS